METNRLAQPEAPPSPPRAPEPPTERALWPTFLRRTLAEEEVRPTRPG
jgi:hypothetical protein